MEIEHKLDGTQVEYGYIWWKTKNYGFIQIKIIQFPQYYFRKLSEAKVLKYHLR